MKNIRIISAGAGSGKTYRLTEELYEIVTKNNIEPSHIIATTFTKKAASELKERVRSKLLEKGETGIANKMEDARIGTVNGICGELLEKFAFEAGISTRLSIIVEDDESLVFKLGLSTVLTSEVSYKMDRLSHFLGFEDGEWHKTVLNVVKGCRSNSITDLSASKAESLKFLEHFSATEPVDTDKLCDDIRSALQEALSVLDASERPPKGLRDDILKRIYAFRGTATMASYRSLNSLKVTNKWACQFDNLMKYVGSGSHEKLPIFHESISEYISTVFDLSQSAIDSYRSFKEERGLIDFVDQEERVLELLSIKTVREEISKELDLLLVDEFQDTSPIQLAIFLKLSELASKTIWVGDPKQSIYAFRGADPSLMDACVSKLGGVKSEDILDSSYRSRAPLVNFTNTIFAEAFSGDMDYEQIVLSPIRKEKKGTIAPLIHWEFTPEERKRILPLDQLASEISKLLASEKKIEDKATKTLREIVPSDIAILFRSNDECTALAGELAQIGIKAKVERDGLNKTLEHMLIVSSLQYLMDRSNTLALANILYLLSDDYNTEEVINSKLRAVENKEKWTSSHPYILMLEKVRTQSFEISPFDTVFTVANSFELREAVSSFGSIESRMRNVDLIVDSAREIEARAAQLFLPSTLDSLFLSLSDLKPQAASGGDDSVNICTYHRSKGLEWPVVIIGSIEKEMHKGVYFGVKVASNSTLSIKDPLKGRNIIFWPDVFGKSKSGASYEAIARSKRGQDLYNKGKLERNRVLYVGLTRARECNIFPLSSKQKPLWPMDACEEFSFAMMDTTQCDGVPVKRTISKTEKWCALPSGPKDHDQLYLSPSGVKDSKGSYKIDDTVEYATRIKTKGSFEDATFGDALHDIVALSPEVRKNQIASVLRGYGIESCIPADDLLASCEQFDNFVETKFCNAKKFVEVPVSYNRKGQIISGIADLVLETDKGMILIDHKTFQGKASELEKHSGKYYGQLETYSEAIEAATGKKVVGIYLNYLSLGKLVEIVSN